MTTPFPPSPGGAPLARSAARGALWLSGLNGLGGVAVLGLNGWLNRTLENAPLQIALWAIVSTLLLFSMFVFELGLTSALMQRKDLDEAAAGGIARLQIAAGFAGSALVWLIATPLASAYSDLPAGRLAELLRTLAPAIAIIATGLAPKALLQRELRFRRVALVEGSCSLVFVAAAVPLAAARGVEGLVLATLVRHSLETCLYWASGSLPPAALLRPASWKVLRDPVRFGLSMGLQSIVGSAVRQADALLVGVLAGQSVALYRYAQTFVVLPFSKLLVYVARAAFPTFAKVQDDPQRALRGLVRVQRLAALVTFPALAGTAAVAPRLFALYLGPQFAPHLDVAVHVTRVLCIGAAAFTYAYAAGVVLNAMGASRPMLARQALGGLAVVVLMLAFAPWGFGAITWGRTLANAVLAVLFLDLARRRLGFTLRLAWDTLKEAAPAALGMFGIVVVAGIACDRLQPDSSAAAAAAGGSALLPCLALGGQVLLGILSYAALLWLLGARPLAEARDLLGPRRAVRPEPVAGSGGG